METMKLKLIEKGISCECYDCYLYIPQRIGYQYRLYKQYDGEWECKDRASGTNDTYENVDVLVSALVFALTGEVTEHYIEKNYVQEEIARLKRFNDKVKPLSSVARNLNLLALQGKMFRAYGREEETERVLCAMLRKTKPNTMLVGRAGCGKTAIVENLAFYITDKRLEWLKEQSNPAPLFNDTIIYDLSLTSLTAGTKYRGELEEKLRDILKCCEEHDNIVLFIDEIHMINKMGDSEGGTGIGQMIKPALARGTIRCIGATTTDEVRFFESDKALLRRFVRVDVSPLSGDKALATAEKILNDYLVAHGMTGSNLNSAVLYGLSKTKLQATAFPDNYINLVDETLASAKYFGKTEVTHADFEVVADRYATPVVTDVRIGFGH